MTLTERIVELCRTTLPARLGSAERANAKLCLIDGLAVALAASSMPSITALRDVLALDAAGQCALIGRLERARADDAALVNGTMVSLLLFDDNHSTMRGHPTGPVLPAVLALADALDLSLTDALDAFVVGYEVECQLGPLFNPSQYEIGWHATATQGTFGATAAACHLLRLDAVKTGQAFGIAASLLGGTRRNFGTMTMSLHSGLAASAGVRAARLAAAGFSADPAIFDGAMAIGQLLSREWRPEQLDASLPHWGAPFAIIDAGPVFKLFPTGRPTIAPIECALDIRARQGFDPGTIARITCEVSFMYPRTLIHAHPSTGLQGKTSLQYCVASALLEGRPTLATYTDAAVNRPSLQALMARVELVVPPHLSEAVEAVRILPFDQSVTVIVEMSDGKVERATIRDHKGMPANPVSEDDLFDKFTACTQNGFAPGLTATVRSYLADGNHSVRGLLALLKPA